MKFNFLSKIKSLTLSKKSNPFDSPRWGDGNYQGDPVRYRNDQEELSALEKLEWVSICVSTIYKKLNRNFFYADFEGNEIELGRIDKRITTPIEANQNKISFIDLVRSVFVHQLLTGNGYLHLSKSTAFSQVRNIYDGFTMFLPNKVKVLFDINELYLLGYEVSFPRGKKARIEPERMIQFKQFPIKNQFVGTGNIELMRLVAEGESETQAYINEFMRNRAMPSIAVTSDEAFKNQKDYARKMDMLSAKYEGRRNAGKFMYLAGGPNSNLKLHSFQLSPDDLSFVETKLHNRQTIISMFQLNSYAVGIPEGSNRAIAKEMKIEFHKTINGFLSEIENTINTQFINKISPEVFIRFEKYPTGDIDDIQKMVSSSLITPKRGSEMLGEKTDNDIEEREKYYLPSNLVPIEDAGMRMGFGQQPQDNDQQNQEGENKNISYCSHTDYIDLDYNPEVLSDPNNVKEIVSHFDDSVPGYKKFQSKYLRRSLESRNRVEEIYKFELASLFKKQAYRINEAFRKNFIEQRKSEGTPSKGSMLEEDPQKAVTLIFDLPMENMEMEKELKRLHTSGIQRGVKDVSTIAAVNINHNVSNPYVQSAITRLGKFALGKVTKAGALIHLNKTTQKALLEQILKGVKNDETVEAIQDRIINKMKSFEGYRARRIARTEARAAWDAGAEIAYNDLGVKTVDVVGCTGISRIAGGSELNGDCGREDIPIAEMSTLNFHPNHIGSIVPSIEP